MSLMLCLMGYLTLAPLFVTGNLCGEDVEEEIEKLIIGIQRTLQLFNNSMPSVNADVILGLTVAKSFLKVVPDNILLPAVGEIVDTIEFVIQDFEEGNGDHSKSTELIPLVLDESLWKNVVLPLEISPSIKIRHSWKKFRQLKDKGLSNANHSEWCLSELLGCRLSSKCLTSSLMAKSYAQTHYLLLIILARALPCTKDLIPAEVESVDVLLCKRMAYENDALMLKEKMDLEDKDILLERIALCGLSGHAEFLRMGWLRKILSWQSIDGCFGRANLRWKRNDVVFGFDCHSHTTAVGIASLAFYLRGILTECF